MKKYFVIAAILGVLLGLDGLAYAIQIQYSGKITQVSCPWGDHNPYAKVGDLLEIFVDYAPGSLMANHITVGMESWGQMFPTAEQYPGMYAFNGPDSWWYANTVSRWELVHDNFKFENDGFGLSVYGSVTPVPEPSAVILVLLGIFSIVVVRIVKRLPVF